MNLTQHYIDFFNRLEAAGEKLPIEVRVTKRSGERMWFELQKQTTQMTPKTPNEFRMITILDVPIRWL